MKKFLLLSIFFSFFLQSKPCNYPQLVTLLQGMPNADSVDCYPTDCGCRKAFAVTIAPFSGRIGIKATKDTVNVLFLTSDCRYIRLDTCIALIGGGVANELAYDFTDTTRMLICANEAAIITVDVIDTSPQPPLPPIFYDTDTACTATALDKPQSDQAPQTGYTDMAGVYWLTLEYQPAGVYYSWKRRRKEQYLKP